MFLILNKSFIIVVVNRHELVTDVLIQKCLNLWKCDQLLLFVAVPVENDNTENEMAQSKVYTNYIFADILSPLFIYSQQFSSKQSWNALSNLIIQLLKNKFMTINYVTRQCVKLLRYEWAHVGFYLISTNQAHNSFYILINYKLILLPFFKYNLGCLTKFGKHNAKNSR